MTQCTGQGRPYPARVAARWRAAAAVAAIVAISGAVNAVDDVSLSIARVEGDGWSADGVAVSFGLPREKALAHAHVDRLRIESFSQELRDVRIECPHLELSGTAIACRHAQLDANWPGIGAQSLRASLVYERRNGALDIALDGIRLAQGELSLQGSLRNAEWTAEAHMQRVPIELVMKIAQDLRLSLPEFSASGFVTLSASGRGTRARLQQADVDATLIDVTANNESGSIATDQLSMHVQAAVNAAAAGDLQFSVQVASADGQAYAQPIFLDLGAHAISLRAEGSLRKGRDLSIDRFSLEHADVAQAHGRAVIRLDHPQPLRSLQLELQRLEFPGAYASYLQPLLLDTSFKSMRTSGKIAGRMLIEEGAARSIDLDFDSVGLDDGAGGFALASLQGGWHWRAASAAGKSNRTSGAAHEVRAAESNLHWRAGALFGMALGEGDLRFITNGRQFRLLEPARIPLLDGAVELQSFRVRNAGTPQVAFTIDATVQPISVQQLCHAFGWPEFGGSVGGAISDLRMRNGVVTLGTTLRASVFDGDVLIEDLRLEQPLGQWPRLYSSITLDNLDLDLVTRAFSFGRITGRLSGAIEGLQLFNWTPVAFDAHLYTPPDDRSRHRISQRAVENIGSIGGGGAGVTAALSSGFLRFFDDFNYDRLGLSCRLENDVCLMSGIAAAPNGGYYLVKGRGLPRIDVIGSSHRVDWPRLVQQLIAVTQSEGPVVN